MMNEWCYPTVQMEMEVHSICCRLEKEGLDLPDIAITGGIASEDQVFKALAFGAPYVTVVGHWPGGDGRRDERQEGR